MKNITISGLIFLTAVLFLGTSKAVAQSDWEHIITPDTSATRNMLRGISGTSSSDIWTVGSFEELYDFPPYNQQNDLIMHWNGSEWHIFPPMNLSTTLDDLYDVEALATNNVWAVGVYNSNAGSQAEMLHYDGSSWQAQNPPPVIGGSALFSLDALNPSNIWAAGSKTGSPTRPAYVLHFNGTSWSEVNVPPVGLYRNQFASIDAVSANDVWAGGFRGEYSGDFHALIMRRNGSAWQEVPLPSDITSPQSEILSVKAIASNDVWAVGYYLAGGGFKLHWDGSTWTQMPEPNGGGGAFAALASNDVFSVGSEIWHWDGTSWTLDDPLAEVNSPALVNTVTLPNGDIWACGVSMDDDFHFHTLVYKYSGSLSVQSNANSQFAIAPNPASERVAFQLSGFTEVTVNVYNTAGERIKSIKSSGQSVFEMDLSDFSEGNYFVQFQNGNSSIIKKLIISK